MRATVLATGAALLLIGGVWTAAFTAIGSTEQPAVIGPAVVVGDTTPAAGPTGSTPTLTPDPAVPSTEPSEDRPSGSESVTRVSPGPVVSVDDHGGRRGGSGNGGGSGGGGGKGGHDG